MKNLKMKHLLIAILSILISTQVLTANNTIPSIADDPPSYTAPNGKTYTWKVNFDKLSVDYTLAELVKMPVWICCGNTKFSALPTSCRKGVLNSGIKPHQINNLDPSKTYTNSAGDKFTPDANRLRLYGFCMVEQDSRGIPKKEVDLDAVCDELREQIVSEGKQPCSDLTPQNLRPDYERNLIFYTVCGETRSRPMTDEFRRPAAPVVKEVVKEVNCVDDVVNLPVTMICKGDSYEWNIDGQSYTYDAEGTYVHSSPKADNCGKTNTILNLDFYDPINKTIVPEQKYDFVGGETYEFEGMTYDAPGTYEREYVDTNGCNAMATLVLQEKEVPKQICSDCVTNARDLGNIELALRGNYGKHPVSPKANIINHLAPSLGVEVGYWKDWRNKQDLLNGLTCKKSLFEYGIIGGISGSKLLGGEPSECNCNDASEGSSIHAYLEPGVRWHFLGACDRYKFLPIPVAGAGLRMHYNDHNIEDISNITLSPKVFAEARWYFSQLFRTPTPNMVSMMDKEREDINSLFFSVGGEAFAPGFAFGNLNYIGYLKLGFRF